VLLLLPGCTTPPPLHPEVSTTHSHSATPGILHYALTAEPTNLDPMLIDDVSTGEMLAQVYEGLLYINETNQIVPLLADGLPTVSSDGRTYTFKIRKGATFQNGRQVTAEDVRYSYNRFLQPALNSPVAMIVVDDILGAKEVANGKAKELAGIKVLDPMTVQITLISPRPYFLGKGTTVPILAKEVIEKGKKDERGNYIIDAANSIGTGPFRITAYQRQSKVVLEANPNYYLGAPKLKEIDRPIVLENKTVRNLYDTSELDMAQSNVEDYQQDKDNPDLKGQLFLNPTARFDYIEIGEKQFAPFKDKRVRQALACAVDKDAIVASVLEGVGKKAAGILAPGMPGYDPNFVGMPHDPERARKLLAEAGYTAQKPLPAFTLVVREQTPIWERIAQVLKDQWAAVGITANLQDMEWGTLLKNESRKTFDANVMGWTAGYLDQNSVLSALLRSDSPQNTLGYANPEMDKLLNAADTSTDPKKRMALYRQAEEKAVQDAVVIPLDFPIIPELRKPYVSGVRYNLFGVLPHTTTVVR
jgi:ABC-type transport system substrate-binding protein